jgi:hypothetical protein
MVVQVVVEVEVEVGMGRGRTVLSEEEAVVRCRLLAAVAEVA